MNKLTEIKCTHCGERDLYDVVKIESIEPHLRNETNYFSTLAFVATKLNIPTGETKEEQQAMISAIQKWACS